MCVRPSVECTFCVVTISLSQKKQKSEKTTNQTDTNYNNCGTALPEGIDSFGMFVTILGVYFNLLLGCLHGWSVPPNDGQTVSVTECSADKMFDPLVLKDGHRTCRNGNYLLQKKKPNGEHITVSLTLFGIM